MFVFLLKERKKQALFVFIITVNLLGREFSGMLKVMEYILLQDSQVSEIANSLLTTFYW